MKTIVISAIVGVSASVFAADAPVVSNVALSQDAQSKEVTITYDLDDYPAVVLMNVATNTAADGTGGWVDVGYSNVTAAAGDVFRIVEKGEGRMIRWYPDVAWNDSAISSMRVTLKAFPTNDPPAYMVCNLYTAERMYYETADQLPGGIDSDDYRTHLFLMRKIPAKNVEFQMNVTNADNAVGFDSARELQHTERFTENFYIGVFELTHWQWEYCRKEKAKYFVEEGDTRPWCDGSPADKLWWGDQLWPTNAQGVLNNVNVGTSTVLAKMRKATGLDRLFIPTESQWEFACRAGKATSFNNGVNLATEGEASNAGLDRIARYKGNGGYIGGSTNPDTVTCGPENGTARVGSYEPNAWGLYDMHGNVAEWCANMFNIWANNDTQSGFPLYIPLDWKTGEVLTDWKGPGLHELAYRTHRVFRGGHWASPPVDCRSSSRKNGQFWSNDNTPYVGARLAYTLKESNPDLAPANPVNDLLPYSNIDDSEGDRQNKNDFWDLTKHKGQHVSVATGTLTSMVSVRSATETLNLAAFDSTFSSAAAAITTCELKTYACGTLIVIR